MNHEYLLENNVTQILKFVLQIKTLILQYFSKKSTLWCIGDIVIKF